MTRGWHRRSGKGAWGEAMARRTERSSPLAGRRLPSADWLHGPSPKLPPLTSFVVVKQSATVSSRSVLRTRAMKPASSGAPSLLARHGLPPRAFAEAAVTCENTRFAGRGEWAGLGAISGATEKIGFGGGVRSTLRRLTHRHCLTTANEVSDGSLAMHPRGRSSSCSRRASADRPGMSPQSSPLATACAHKNSQRGNPEHSP
jgi:hypothetical protein